MGSQRGIPEATVARLPVYHRVLASLHELSVPMVSSDELAEAAGVTSAKLRKDLSYLGSYGTRGVGYDVEFLLYQIARELGLTQDWPVIIIGVGNLGRALANYGGFATRGFRVVGLLDSDPAVVGQDVNQGLAKQGINSQVIDTRDHTSVARTIAPLDQLESIVAARQPSIAVIATPAKSAQQVCDRVVRAGITSILNFAPVVLNVPDGVEVRKVDLATELQILAFHEQRRSRELDAPALAGGAS